MSDTGHANLRALGAISVGSVIDVGLVTLSRLIGNSVPALILHGGAGIRFYRRYTRSAKLSLVSPERFAASTAGRSIERQTVVHDCILVAVLHSGHFFVAQPHGHKTLLDRGSLKRNIRRLRLASFEIAKLLAFDAAPLGQIAPQNKRDHAAHVI